MPRKKKSFIDKKQSSTFHLVRRSQQDVLWEEGQVSSQNHISSHIHNSNNNNNSSNNNSNDGNEDGSDEEGSAVVIPNDYVLMPSPFNVNPKFQEPIALERVVEKPDPTMTTTTTNIRTTTTTTTTTKRRKENWSGSWLGRTEELLAEAGVTEYDYEKHLKAITGTGDFVAATGTDSATTVTSKLRSRVVPDDGTFTNTFTNTNRPPPPPLELVENIALSPAVMDEDVAAALFGDFDFDNNNDNDNDTFEELLDDFVLTASAPEEEVPLPAAYQNESTEFDFQAHIQRLMERARQEPLQTLPSEFVNHAEWNRQKRDFAAHVTPLHEQKQKQRQLIDNHDDDNDNNDDNDDESEEEFEEYDVEQDWGDPSSDPTNDKEMRPMEKEEERRLAEKLFEQTLAEYDDDELGDLEGYFESTRANHNNADNENNNNNNNNNNDDNDAKLLATILQSELTVEDEVPQWQPLSKPKKKGGSSYTALVGTSLQVHDSKAIHNSSNNKNKNKNNKSSNYFNDNGIPATIRVQKELDQAQQQLYSQAHLIDQAPPPEDVLIDGKSYFSETPRNPWDCESVLTTYSNLDNRPCTIDTNTHTSRRLRSKAKHLIPLSEKTGLPLFNNDDNNDDDDNNNDADALTLATTGAFTRNGVNKGRSRNRHETPAEKKARKAQIKQERKICRLQKKVVGHVYAQEFQKRHADLVGDDVAGHSVFRY